MVPKSTKYVELMLEFMMEHLSHHIFTQMPWLFFCHHRVLVRIKCHGGGYNHLSFYFPAMFIALFKIPKSIKCFHVSESKEE